MQCVLSHLDHSGSLLLDPAVGQKDGAHLQINASIPTVKASYEMFLGEIGGGGTSEL